MLRISFFGLTLILVGVVGVPGVAGGPAGAPLQTDLFVGGKDGYHTYRIPALVVTTRGTLLAICEGRKTGRSDHGDLDLVMRRSTDTGRTWGPLELIYDDYGKITFARFSLGWLTRGSDPVAALPVEAK